MKKCFVEFTLLPSLTFFLMLLTNYGYSQYPVQQRISTNFDEVALETLPLTDSAYIVLSRSADALQRDGFILMEMNKAGQIRWARSYYDSLNINVIRMIKTHDNSFVLLSDHHQGNYYSNLMITKFDTTGNILWNNIYTTTSNLSPSGHETFHECSDHGFIMVSNTYDQLISSQLIIKTDSAGNLLWNKKFSYGANDFWGSAIHELAGGSFFYTASGMDDATMQVSFWLFAKLDSVGNIVHLYNSPQYWDDLSYTNVYSSGDGHCILFNSHSIAYVDTDAIPRWIKTFNSPLTNEGSIRLLNGGFVVTGNNNGDASLIRTDSMGSVFSCERLDGQQYDIGISLFQSPDSSLTIAGGTSVTGQHDFDICIFRSDSTGNFGCNMYYDTLTSTTDTFTYFVDSVSISNDTLTQSTVQISDSSISFQQIDLCNTNGINEPEVDFNLNVFPNPTTGKIILQLEKNISGLEISITNTFGQIIRFEKYENASEIELEIQGDSGLFFLNVKNGNISKVYKILKM